MIVKLQYKVGVFLLNTLYNELNVIMKIKWFLKMLPVLYLTDYHNFPKTPSSPICYIQPYS